MTRLEEVRRQLKSQLAAVERGRVTEQRESHALVKLRERVKEAVHALRSQCRTVERSREEAAKGSPELYWMARGLAAETQAMFRRLEMAELEERISLLQQVQARFRKLLPEATINQLMEMDASPGEVVVKLSEAESQNHSLAMELLRAQGEVAEWEGRLEAEKVAYSNAASLAELTAFESEVLEVTPVIPGRNREGKSGFGLGYLEEVTTGRTEIEVKLRTMEEELGKMRHITVEAVNALEDPLAKTSVSRGLVEECELLAARYIRKRASLKGRAP